MNANNCARILKELLRVKLLIQGFLKHFQKEGNWCSQVGKTIRIKLLCENNTALDGQLGRKNRPCSQAVCPVPTMTALVVGIE